MNSLLHFPILKQCLTAFNGFIQYLQNLHLIDDVNTHVIEPFSTESIHAIAAGHANPPDLVPISEAERQPTPNPEILPLPQPEPAIEPQRNLECVVSSARPRPKPKRISRPATSALASFETQGDSVSKLAASIPRILNERVTSEDMQCLISPTKWLNDEIINFYGALIQTQSNAGGDGCLRVHVFSTFFFNQLEAGYKEKRVARWTRKVRDRFFINPATLIFMCSPSLTSSPRTAFSYLSTTTMYTGPPPASTFAKSGLNRTTV